MKRTTILSTVLVFLFFNTSCDNKIKQDNNKTNKYSQTSVIEADTIDATNNFYDNAETYSLKTFELEISGEIKNPGKVDFSGLTLHSIIVKETELSGEKDTFIGAYRYDGYSLYDILNNCILNKKNAKEFNPIIDLFVELENDKGEKTVISWGEIFYPNHLHEIIIATKVMRIVPSKTNELWKLPTESKLIVSSDLITERNINRPSKITIKSYNKNLKVEKGKKPLFSPKVDIYVENKIIETLYKNPSNIQEKSLHTIFYGRGRGIHSTEPFTGVSLKSYFNTKIKRTQKALREGIFVIAADDGYRGVYTYSELCNRNDQAEVLLICKPELKDNGIFKVFPSCDFFSDRAIKGINGIYYSENQK
ncbi:MAG: hypothetical protein JXR51_13820 [Bacteroidales bacterium]|nr:hypothetical protein [Bacteroidales bacterium]MBN2758245.1 hypothetical protein [Bacteroidales bacterium]